MPIGTHHDLTGLLLRDGSATVLEVTGGGTWRLEIRLTTALRAKRLIGRRVRVTGIRDGFDLLVVTTIEQDVRVG